MARGAKLDQLELEREARLDAVALGKAGWKEKEEGVRRTHDWRVVGRVAPPTGERASTAGQVQWRCCVVGAR